MALLRFIVCGLVAGWILGKMRRGKGYGVLGNLLIGAIGSLIGWFLMGFFQVQAPTILAQVAVAVAGAIVFFLLIGAFKSKRSGSKGDKE